MRQAIFAVLLAGAVLGCASSAPSPGMASAPAPTGKPTPSATATPDATATPGPTPDPTPEIGDDSVYGVLPVGRAEVIAILTRAYPKLSCDKRERVWEGEQPAPDGTPWLFLSCWTDKDTGVSFITDPEGRLRSAGAISVHATQKAIPVLAALISAVAGPTGASAFPRLRKALEAGTDLILAQDGYRFEASVRAPSWTVDVTATR